MSAELIQPPSSQQAEVAVLSAILAGRPFDGIELKPEDFYFAQNRAVYQAATELASRRQPVDVITIADHLAATGALEDIGGMAVRHTRSRRPTSAPMPTSCETTPRPVR